LTGIFLIGVIIISISFVSANWFTDLFKFGQEGDGDTELPESFNVNIQTSNSPPTIVSWTAPDTNLVTPGIQAYLPNCGSTTTIGTTEFKITLSDPNGCADLADAQVQVQFSKGGVNRNAAPVTCTAIGAGTCTGNNLQFDCNSKISMQFYDAQGDWVITVTATDGTDPASNSPKVSDGTSNYPFFTYGSKVCIELSDSDDPTVPLDTLKFSGVSATSTNKQADNNMIVANKGNIGIDAVTSYLQILGHNLVGQTSGNTNQIEETSFRVDETDPACDQNGPTLTEVLQKIPEALLLTGAATDVDLFFCIEQMNLPSGQTGLVSDTYESGESPWEIWACETGC